jgi:autotransporter-associated beta strand protein
MTDHERNGEDETQAARRTAYALGQLSETERAEVSAELAASPQAREEAEAIQAIAARLSEATRTSRQPDPSPELREALERRLTELERASYRSIPGESGRRRWPRRLAALALAASILAMAFPIARTTRSPEAGDRSEVALKTSSARTAANQLKADAGITLFICPTRHARVGASSNEYEFKIADRSNLFFLTTKNDSDPFNLPGGTVVPEGTNNAGQNPVNSRFIGTQGYEAPDGSGEGFYLTYGTAPPSGTSSWMNLYTKQNRPTDSNQLYGQSDLNLQAGGSYNGLALPAKPDELAQDSEGIAGNQGVVLSAKQAEALGEVGFTLAGSNALNPEIVTARFYEDSIPGVPDSAAGNLRAGISTLTLDSNNASNAFGGALFSGAGGLTESGNGTLTITGANSYNGPVLASGGILSLGVASTDARNEVATIASIDREMAKPGQQETANSGTPSAASAAGAYGGATTTTNGTILGDGPLNVANAKPYSGPVTVSGGTLQLAAAPTTDILARSIDTSTTATLTWSARTEPSPGGTGLSADVRPGGGADAVRMILESPNSSIPRPTPDVFGVAVAAGATLDLNRPYGSVTKAGAGNVVIGSNNGAGASTEANALGPIRTAGLPVSTSEAASVMDTMPYLPVTAPYSISNVGWAATGGSSSLNFVEAKSYASTFTVPTIPGGLLYGAVTPLPAGASLSSVVPGAARGGQMARGPLPAGASLSSVVPPGGGADAVREILKDSDATLAALEVRAAGLEQTMHFHQQRAVAGPLETQSFGYQQTAKELAATIDQIAKLREKTASGPASKPVPKKPLESWKPARVVPNSSRLMVGEHEEIPLKGMQVDVRVDGFRARVLIDLYYYNDRPQQLEGNFQLRLPDEASPYFFAFGRTVFQAPQLTAADSMFFKPQQVSAGDTTPEKILQLRGNSWEEPKVARMVPKEKASLAYRDTVRRRVDPALVEWSGAGVFQCKVFPLAPHSMHRITMGYDVDLLKVGDDLELRLDLPGQPDQPGQAIPTIVDMNIAAADARQVSLDAPATLTPGPSPEYGRGETSRLMYRLVDPKDRPLAVRLRKPGVQMLVGNDEATGDYFATRVTLPVPEAKTADRPKQAIFLVDTSLSSGPQFPLWTKLLRATLEKNRDQIKEFAVLFFNVESFWWQEKFVANTPENVDALMSYTDSLALEGATDLGRALQEAAAPKWRRVGRGSPSDRSPTNVAPDLFLLSDGAATWGEDRWPLMASSVCSTGFSRNPESQPPKGGTTSALFAYRTGLAGGDPRFLAYLAQQTGGAVFSLVGEAEIATAAVAHRNRPWKLTGIEMAGARDLLVAGRPQYVFPGQQLLVVGRLEHRTGRTDPADHSLVFTLQQGKATQTITLKMEQTLPSELAARTFGQVATSQLEDVSGVSATAEPVATAYARHFRVTGRTCSLLMLESEQDYARFNIKPEEDSFVVKDRTAGPIVDKAIADVTATMSDPKQSFLAWYARVQQSPEVHFELPASLKVAVEGLPAEAFAVNGSPLVCKLRLRKDLPENLRQPWYSGLPDYETLAAEAQRRLTNYGADDALRALSSLVEIRPGDGALERNLAFSAIEWQRPAEAYHLLRRAAESRTYEPISFHAMAHCLEQIGRIDLAIVYYELACGGQWDGRFGDMHNIAQLDYLRFLRRVVRGQLPTSLTNYAKARLATLSAMQLRDTADIAALILWNTDGTDVDLHVIEPSGEECYYQHAQTASGGHISRDVTTGFGPELYLLPAAPAGKYEVFAHYFATDANRASTRTKVLALIYENWGAKDEHVTVKAIGLTGQKESHPLATVKR